MAQPQRKFPSDRTVAFAAAIVSSKPADLTVRDYITLLTRHVAKGRRENALSAAYRHLDRSAYWRSECERAKEDCRVAREERLEALREVESLKAKLEFAKAAAVGGKRKRAGADVVPYSREIKKGRKDKEVKREVFLGGVVIEEVDVVEGDAGGQSLMRKLFQIGLCFKPGVQVEATTMVYHICCAVAETAKVATEALRQGGEPISNGSDLSTTMTAAGRMVAAVLAGQQKLIRMNGGEPLQGRVTYALVSMYEKLLLEFETISLQTANAEASTESASDSSLSLTKQKPKSKGGPPRVNIKDIPTLNALTGLLSGILKQLDPQQASHKEVFEGFFYCILSKLGNRIYTVNFSHPRAATIAEELEVLVTTDDPGPDRMTTRPRPIPVRQAHLEAPYLLHLLKQALAMTPSFLAVPAPSSTSKSVKAKSTPKAGSISKTSLSLAAKERLQATLVHAIFGPEGVDEDSDLFLNCLQMPPATGTSLTVPRVKEAEVGQWFRGEVWRLLGWEVLGKEIHTGR